MKKKLTLEDWKKFVSENSTNSYSAAVILAILCIWEAGCTTTGEAMQELIRSFPGLSGTQAGMASDYALHYDFEEHLDPEIVKIKRDKNLVVTEKIEASKPD